MCVNGCYPPHPQVYVSYKTKEVSPQLARGLKRGFSHLSDGVRVCLQQVSAKADMDFEPTAGKLEWKEGDAVKTIQVWRREEGGS